MPRNTVTVANIPHMHITIRNLGIASGPSRGGSWKKKMIDFHPYCYLSGGLANKTSPRFYLRQTSAASHGYLNS